MIYLDIKKIPFHIVALIGSIIAALIVLTWVNITIAQTNQKITCSLFETQREAQQKYDQDPTKYAKLDGYDKDGMVCESLKK